MTPKQHSFIETLVSERPALDADRVARIRQALADDVSGREASSIIDWLLAQPRTGARPERAVTVSEPGVYETPDGDVFIVKPTRENKTRLYAKRLVEIGGERLNDLDEHVQIEFEYAKGAIFNLTPEMKMPLERAKALTIRYGRCIVCGARLKDATSVERGIGPVCIKSFAAPQEQPAQGAWSALATQ